MHVSLSIYTDSLCPFTAVWTLAGRLVNVQDCPLFSGPLPPQGALLLDNLEGTLWVFFSSATVCFGLLGPGKMIHRQIIFVTEFRLPSIYETGVKQKVSTNPRWNGRNPTSCLSGESGFG